MYTVLFCSLISWPWPGRLVKHSKHIGRVITQWHTHIARSPWFPMEQTAQKVQAAVQVHQLPQGLCISHTPKCVNSPKSKNKWNISSVKVLVTFKNHSDWVSGHLLHLCIYLPYWIKVSKQIISNWEGASVSFILWNQIYMSLCQKVLSEDHPFFGPKCFFRFKFSLNKPNFIWKSMHQRDNKDKLDSQSQFWVSKIWKFTPNPGRKSAKEGWTFQVHRFSCRFVCIFLL